VTGAGRGHFEFVDEEASPRVARIERQQAVVDVLLEALAAVAGIDGAARTAGLEARLQPLRLRHTADVLDDDAPLAAHVGGAHRPAVDDARRADEAVAGADPLGPIVRLARVVAVVEVVLLSVDQRLAGLIGHVGVLEQKQPVLLHQILFIVFIFSGVTQIWQTLPVKKCEHSK